ncbi:Fur-regulated protein [Salmonella enterica subsp. enterica serovar Madelia]|uniref:Fur-regulated protein n=2 Tax=Salmonella enterica I TaxID=59201 RepID=A0A6X9B6V9_SALET|nr:Fur-regulated protein [Salmonella enterica]EBS4187469.1 Fur-regulated protein [Salmonella enterica subsp. enterica serovar Mbandaka]EDB3635866.1 Fur-regulated protein [Salmonella enterica subsp. enterica serovar Oranienburg]EEI9212068.1 Fur-regulated protein [Salmonella enterica subsp. enterica serovar Carrau]EGI5857449.1 Fur-regulated protein [Salmonella enterica subsp. enterica serovar Madelia]EGI6379046.1 Fur-regulated protein [Salmonella enterica subsp. enterica serovar Cubana]
MSNEIITLSGAAADVLYSLFFRGALLSGDLPSKSGTDELREMGFAETRYTATEYQKENHFTFLTSEGQKFAVEHLVNTRFGKQQYCTSMTLGIEIDTSAAQKEIDKLDQRIRDTVSFELIRNGVPFIKDATIASGAIQAAAIETPQPVTNIYNINLGIQRDESVQNKVTISTDKLEVKPGIDANTEALIENALKNATESAARDVAKQVAADQKAMDELTSHVRKTIIMDCYPGGVIWQLCRR